MGARKKPARPKPAVATRDRILDLAEQLMQTRGFNGFSYADVAAEIRISTASLHYHFRTKAELGAKVIERYAGRVYAALDAIDAAALEVPQCLTRYTEIYAGVLAQERMCLVGMLAAEFATLPAPMQKTLRAYISHNERWLEPLIARGRAAGQLAPTGTDRETALMLIGALEGAMLIARPMMDKTAFVASVRQLLASLQRTG
jgi:TetR/AcrR family transcriptional regulator, transcriptional repressor for nem operon